MAVLYAKCCRLLVVASGGNCMYIILLHINWDIRKGVLLISAAHNLPPRYVIKRKMKEEKNIVLRLA